MISRSLVTCTVCSLARTTTSAGSLFRSNVFHMCSSRSYVFITPCKYTTYIPVLCVLAYYTYLIICTAGNYEKGRAKKRRPRLMSPLTRCEMTDVRVLATVYVYLALFDTAHIHYSQSVYLIASCRCHVCCRALGKLKVHSCGCELKCTRARQQCTRVVLITVWTDEGQSSQCTKVEKRTFERVNEAGATNSR